MYPETSPYDITAAVAVPADVDTSSCSHISAYIDGMPCITSQPDDPMVTADIVVCVCITDPVTYAQRTYKLVKRIAMDKCKLALQAETQTPVQVLEGEDPEVVAGEMEAFYAARRAREMAGINESAGTKSATVMYSCDDESAAAKNAEGKVGQQRASGKVVIKDIKDKAHARHVFTVKHAPKLKNAKITRVMMED